MTASALELNERWWVYQSDSGGDPESTWIMKGPKEDQPDVYVNAVATIRFDDLDVAERIVAEHNALLGCSDPHGFVKAVRYLTDAAGGSDLFDPFDPIDFRHANKIAWLREEKK